MDFNRLTILSIYSKMADFFDDIPEAEAEVVVENGFYLPDPEPIEEDHLT